MYRWLIIVALVMFFLMTSPFLCLEYLKGMSSSGSDTDHYVMINKLLDFFIHKMRVRIAMTEITLNIQDFSSLHTQGMTYHQKCFKQGIMV
jgi:hypothetical protein